MNFDTAPAIALALISTVIVIVSVLNMSAPEDPQFRRRGERFFLLFALFLLPLFNLGTGISSGISSSTNREFCLSCHEMRPYGASLHIDDSESLPGVHYQNGLIAAETTCYGCHSDYTLFGPLKAKMNGLMHVYVHYLGEIPENIELYQPYSSKNCLHCHEGKRSFIENKKHQSSDAPLEKIVSGEISCMDKGCHDFVHDVESLKYNEFWNLPENLKIEQEQQDDLDDLFGGDTNDSGSEAADDDLADLFDEEQ